MNNLSSKNLFFNFIEKSGAELEKYNQIVAKRDSAAEKIRDLLTRNLPEELEKLEQARREMFSLQSEMWNFEMPSFINMVITPIAKKLKEKTGKNYEIYFYGKTSNHTYTEYNLTIILSDKNAAFREKDAWELTILPDVDTKTLYYIPNKNKIINPNEKYILPDTIEDIWNAMYFTSEIEKKKMIDINFFLDYLDRMYYANGLRDPQSSTFDMVNKEVDYKEDEIVDYLKKHIGCRIGVNETQSTLNIVCEDCNTDLFTLKKCLALYESEI